MTGGDMQAVLALVRRAATVDPENPGAAEAAFDALMTPEIPPLYRFIHARVGSDQAAEDLLQETLLGAWRQLGSFDGRSRFSTWLLAIAKYRVIDWQRRVSRQRPRQAGSLDDDETGLAATLAAPEEGGDPVTRLDLGAGSWSWSPGIGCCCSWSLILGLIIRRQEGCSTSPWGP